MAHLWASWLHNPCRLRAPPLRSGGQNQKWPTCGQGGYITPAASGSPSASERGTKSEVAHKWARWLHNPCRLGEPLHFRAGGKNQKWPTCGQGGYITPATSGSPSAVERGGQNQKWPTSGQGGYITPAASGSPSALERGAESEVAHKWARCLHNLFCAFQPILNSPRNSEYFQYRHIRSDKKNSPCRMSKTKSAAPPASTKHIVPCDNFGVRRVPPLPPPFGVRSRPGSAPMVLGGS